MTIDPINFTLPLFDRRFDFNTEELSSLELAGRTVQKLNEVIDLANTVDGKIAGKEDSATITTNRKLSPNGDFTGTLAGESISQVKTDINNSLSLVNTLIAMVNNRESIGTIYDGGLFTESTTPTTTIEGGLFS